jgi:hypothetical protein
VSSRGRDEVHLDRESSRPVCHRPMCRLLTVPYTGYCQWRERAPSARTLANSIRTCGWPRSTRATVAAMGVIGFFEYCVTRDPRQLWAGAPEAWSGILVIVPRDDRLESHQADSPRLLDRQFSGWPVNRA